MVNWKKEESSNPMPLLDFKSSPGQVIVRKPLKVEDRAGMDGERYKAHLYEMAFMTTNEYMDYSISNPLPGVSGDSENGSYFKHSDGRVELYKNIKVSGKNGVWVLPTSISGILKIDISNLDGSTVKDIVYKDGVIRFTTELENSVVLGYAVAKA